MLAMSCLQEKLQSVIPCRASYQDRYYYNSCFLFVYYVAKKLIRTGILLGRIIPSNWLISRLTCIATPNERNDPKEHSNEQHSTDTSSYGRSVLGKKRRLPRFENSINLYDTSRSAVRRT